MAATNKIRMEYIETELAKRQNRKLAEQNAGRAAGSDQTQTAADTQQLPLREPATLGKLHEVDLGQEAKLQNIARTQEATARLAGKRSPSPEKRPVDSRGRHRRRTSADIERDRLVEEVLRESKRMCILFQAMQPLANDKQWTSMMNPSPNLSKMTRPPTTALQSNSDGIFWKPSRLGVGWQDRGLPATRARPIRDVVGPSLEEAAACVLLIGSSK